MRYFLDTEFIEQPCTIDLISLALVSERGDELYLVSSEFDPSRAGEFVRENVLPNLGDAPRVSRDEMRRHVLGFVGRDGEAPGPAFWGYYADYDWVAFCWLFGRMVDLPDHFPKYCMDIKQWAMDLGNPDLPADPDDEHNALADARWNRRAYDHLDMLSDRRVIVEVVDRTHNPATYYPIWVGAYQSIDQVRNAKARSMARVVFLDGVAREKGDWRVRLE